MPYSKPTLNLRRSTLALVTSLAITVGSYIVVAVEAQRLLDAQATMEQSRVIVRALRDVRNDLLDMETGQRGFLLTAEPSYLDPFHDGQKALREDLATLKTEVPKFAIADMPAVLQLEQLADATERELLTSIALRTAGDRNDSERTASLDKGRRHMAQVRELVETHTARYRAARAPLEHLVRTQLARAQVALGVSALALIALVGTAFWNIRSNAVRLKAAADRLAVEAAHDPLTDLPNRRYLDHWLAHALARAQRIGEPLAALYLDLDDFAGINDVHGHAAGDRTLRRVSEILRASTRESDFIARCGGDEFVVVVSGMNEGQLHAFANKLVQSLANGDAAGGVSIGVASADLDADSAESLLKKADEAMYRAKGAGKNAVRFHARSMAQAGVKAGPRLGEV